MPLARLSDPLAPHQHSRSIRGLFHLFYLRGCLALEAIPTHFREVLSDEGEEGVFKAEKLLIQELGGVPL